MINIIIKCGIWQPVEFELASCSWKEMIFYRISEFILPKLIQRYDKIHLKTSSKTRDLLKLYRLSDATFYYRINTTYQFMKPFMVKKNVYFWEKWSL